MLVYHPAFDMNHGMFRMLRLLESNPEHRLHWDTFRILDLYYLFPHLLADATLPRPLTARKKAFAGTASAYSYVPSPKMFIQQMRGIHEIVARSLAAKGLLEPAELDASVLARTEVAIPAALATSFAGAEADKALVALLATEIAAIPLNGSNGLKQRTRLLEYRYDPA